jgi:dUTP pyrophosphatase
MEAELKGIPLGLAGMVLKVKLLNVDAKIPTKAHEGDLGYDLYSAEDIIIKPNCVTKVHTGIACSFPNGYGALMRDRSSMATKAEIFVVAGVIDSGYRGEILVAFMNPFDKIYIIKKGDKIAQMIVTKVNNCVIEEVEELDDTSRSDGGFGSTGR